MGDITPIGTPPRTPGTPPPIVVRGSVNSCEDFLLEAFLSEDPEKLKELKEIDLEKADITFESLQNIINQLQKCPNLQSFDVQSKIRGIFNTKTGAQIWQNFCDALGACKHLQKVGLDLTNLDPDQLKYFIKTVICHNNEIELKVNCQRSALFLESLERMQHGQPEPAPRENIPAPAIQAWWQEPAPQENAPEVAADQGWEQLLSFITPRVNAPAVPAVQALEQRPPFVPVLLRGETPDTEDENNWLTDYCCSLRKYFIEKNAVNLSNQKFDEWQLELFMDLVWPSTPNTPSASASSHEPAVVSGSKVYTIDLSNSNISNSTINLIKPQFETFCEKLKAQSPQLLSINLTGNKFSDEQLEKLTSVVRSNSRIIDLRVDNPTSDMSDALRLNLSLSRGKDLKDLQEIDRILSFSDIKTVLSFSTTGAKNGKFFSPKPKPKSKPKPISRLRPNKPRV